MAENLPYIVSVGTLEKMLDKIKTASVPERVTQDFVNTKLAMKGGTANACIPFLKKLGLIGSDGVPTDLYKELRNPKKSRQALGKAFRRVYARLYEMNEYIHDADDNDILGLIVECTGAEKTAPSTKCTLSTFNMLRKHADFEPDGTAESEPDETQEPEIKATSTITSPPSYPMISLPAAGHHKGINLSYTINLNLPTTKDIEVFNAIFKSLKQHLMDQ